MPSALLSAAAQDDIQSILAWTYEHFGSDARERYKVLLKHAIADVGKDPIRPGSMRRDELGDGVCTFHIAYSSLNVPPTFRVKRPRHIVIYRCNQNGAILISRILHDSMDLQRHLPQL